MPNSKNLLAAFFSGQSTFQSREQLHINLINIKCQFKNSFEAYLNKLLIIINLLKSNKYFII